MFSDIQFTKFHQKCREIVFHGSSVSESEHYQTESPQSHQVLDGNDTKCRSTQKQNIKCILLEWRFLELRYFQQNVL